MTTLTARKYKYRTTAPLLLTAAIWGFAFVAQRTAMDHVGAFTFNGVRFLMGSLALVPVAGLPEVARAFRAGEYRRRDVLAACGLAGSVLFIAASLQQLGVVQTTAGKAGFITGLYVVIVPLLGLLWGQRVPWMAWAGVMLAVAGMYLLSVEGRLALAPGDALVLVGACFWAIHVQVVGHFTGRVPPLVLAMGQFAVCGALSSAVALFSEPITLPAIVGAGWPILYAGLLSTGVAYTLQVVAQQHAAPTEAALILSLESVFAALGGGLLLGERLAPRHLLGCALMLAGMILAQLNGKGCE